ncbi:hypothetical protein MRX96_054012 [Rhipicephalus microplus]
MGTKKDVASQARHAELVATTIARAANTASFISGTPISKSIASIAHAQEQGSIQGTSYRTDSTAIDTSPVLSSFWEPHTLFSSPSTMKTMTEKNGEDSLRFAVASPTLSPNPATKVNLTLMPKHADPPSPPKVGNVEASSSTDRREQRQNSSPRLLMP